MIEIVHVTVNLLFKVIVNKVYIITQLSELNPSMI
ncbi:hypothetical protein CTER_0073 [Ruminiclostridium cellobioparum subsp. termitidis CT1112]|uniref:Uncharacterized protein n=1 Tax=Ruminiclostridium cellobioparum subsp. termitidis CT1112 TaxID=1195236 RepID=S0FYI4_RUMCE|nr:hypothetical protein CTER_0073 [Ruminiclostridium cellobioparum subsp. termitidis CT1112]